MRRLKVIFKSLVYVVALLMSFSVDAKVIGVMLDDSGSMSGNPGAAANIFLQYLNGMLDYSKDKLTIHLTSNVTISGSQKKILSTLKKQNNFNGSSADISKQVIHQLKKSKDKDKWLVIITDAAGIDSSQSSKNASDSIKYGIKTIIISINQKIDNNFKQAWLPAYPVIKEISPSSDSKEILDTFIDIIKIINKNSLSELAANEFKQVNKRKVVVNSAFPLKRMSVLSVNKIISSVSQKQGRLIEQTFDLKYSDQTGLISHVRQSHRENDVIEPGEIELTIKSNLNKKYVLNEVALDFGFEIIKEDNSPLKDEKGNVVKLSNNNLGNLINICKNEDLYLKVNLKQPNKKNFILPNAKQLDILLSSINQSKQKQTYKLSYDKALDAYKLDIKKKVAIGSHSFSISMDYPGYFQTKTNVFSIDVKTCRNLEPLVIRGDNQSLPITDIPLWNAEIDLNLIGNNIVDTTDDWDVEVTTGTGEVIEVVPDANKNILRWIIKQPYSRFFSPCFAAPLKEKISVKFINKNNTNEFKVIQLERDFYDVPFELKCFPLILKVVFTLFMFIWIWGLLTKPRFRNGKFRIVKQPAQEFEYETPWVIRTKGINTFIALFVPYVAERAVIFGFSVKAYNNYSILINASGLQSIDNEFIEENQQYTPLTDSFSTIEDGLERLYKFEFT